jgi:hypothetical protein
VALGLRDRVAHRGEPEGLDQAFLPHPDPPHHRDRGQILRQRIGDQARQAEPAQPLFARGRRNLGRQAPPPGVAVEQVEDLRLAAELGQVAQPAMAEQPPLGPILDRPGAVAGALPGRDEGGDGGRRLRPA